jgi:probable F420-dependent oxidoreductase
MEEVAMRIGVVFPQLEIGTDPEAIKGYAQAVEEMGYDHLLAYDHVLGVHPDVAVRPGAYTHESLFHEPMVLFAYLAAVTQRLEFVTGILILPQRQTALVAKQAAEIAVLASGRLRLGVGVGWNPGEYVGLGQDFHTRGRRMEEQISLLRALWAEPVVSFEGKFDRIERAGINPLPPGRSIPIWMGGMSDTVIDRVGRMADGWFPQYRNPDELPPAIERVKAAASAVGRDPESIGFEPRVHASQGIETAIEQALLWERAGATHLTINTMDAGYTSVDQHIDAVRRFIEGLQESPLRHVVGAR